MAQAQHTPTPPSLEEALTTVLFCFIDDTLTSGSTRAGGAIRSTQSRSSRTRGSSPSPSSSSFGGRRASGPFSETPSVPSRTCSLECSECIPFLFPSPSEEAEALFGARAPGDAPRVGGSS